MLTKLLWLFMMGIATTTWGQLGESLDQCDKRFGADPDRKPARTYGSFSREYSKDGFHITIRFITLSTGTPVAGWICYTPSSGTNTLSAERQKIREAASPSWTPVDNISSTTGTDPHTTEITTSHNAFVTKTRATISKVTGWTSMPCWLSPTAFAADNGVSLILFSDIYLKQFEYGQTRDQKVNK